MGKPTGTLVGATVRPADDQDLYPVALQNELLGGHHSKTTIAQRDALPAHLRQAGMTCYVSADGVTYELGNDLITWTAKSQASGNGGNPTDPGTQDTESQTIAILSGNLGEWIDLPAKSADITAEDISIQYKGDMMAFATRSIVYLKGQFSLAAAYANTTITLGTLPANYRPAVQLKQYIIVKNIELYLVLEINGDVKLVSKDGFNLPVETDLPTDCPYFLNLFFHPAVTVVVPTTYTATRTASFTRNNCGTGSTGTAVDFSKDYTSTISQTDADNQAANDANFNTEGQAWANDDSNGATCSTPTLYLSLRAEILGGNMVVKAFLKDADGNPVTISQEVVFDWSYHSELVSGGNYDDTVRSSIPVGESSTEVWSYSPSFEDLQNLTITEILPGSFGGYTIIAVD